jgi:hypothetical protein
MMQEQCIATLAYVWGINEILDQINYNTVVKNNNTYLFLGRSHLTHHHVSNLQYESFQLSQLIVDALQ